MDKAIFIDKDGVINENLYEVDGVIMSPATLDQVRILDYVKEGIDKLKEDVFKIVIITNQPGLAFGYISIDNFNKISEFLKKELGIDAIYFCPHHPTKGKVGEYVKKCECRKPSPFLLHKACKEMNLDVGGSYMVGDSLSDIQTGKAGGVKKTFLIGAIREDIIQIQHTKGIFPDYTCKNLLEVANKIREIENNSI